MSKTVLPETKGVNNVSENINITNTCSDTAAQKESMCEKTTASTSKYLKIFFLVDFLEMIKGVSCYAEKARDFTTVEKKKVVHLKSVLACEVRASGPEMEHWRIKGDCNHDYLSMDLCSRMTGM